MGFTRNIEPWAKNPRASAHPPPSLSSSGRVTSDSVLPTRKRSLFPLAPESPRKKSRRASHGMPVSSVLTHTGLSTMCALILLACCLAAWPIHLCTTRPVARIFHIID